jgi:hypothetical protein
VDVGFGGWGALDLLDSAAAPAKDLGEGVGAGDGGWGGGHSGLGVGDFTFDKVDAAEAAVVQAEGEPEGGAGEALQLDHIEDIESGERRGE